MSSKTEVVEITEVNEGASGTLAAVDQNAATVDANKEKPKIELETDGENVQGVQQPAGTSTDDEQTCRFEIKSYVPVTLWSWDIAVDNCAICRNNIMDPCIDCQFNADGAARTAVTEEQCTVAWGACNHAFHFHCISRWLKTREVCPMDNTPWEFQRYGR